MKTSLIVLNLALSVVTASAFCLNSSAMSPAAERLDDGYLYVRDIPYVAPSEKDEYKLERCKLDIYYPEDVEGFATLVWFHGGGLTGGSKHLPEEFRRQGFAVVSVNYRLFPKAKCPAYVSDAAESVAWVYNHISEYGGDNRQIYVAGHSAGGYLTYMAVLAEKYSDKFGFDADKIVKAYPISGQTTTHYTIRTERGIDFDLPVIDYMAPSNNVRRDGAPFLIITGDRRLEQLARYEENAHIHAILEHFGHPSELLELQGFDHGTVLGPACLLIREDIKKNWKVFRDRIEKSENGIPALVSSDGRDYRLSEVIEVAGRQGVASDGEYYYISGSTALYKYDRQGNLVSSNENPFRKLKLAANHFGDIDVYGGEIFTGAETFMDGVGTNIQIAVYDAETLKYKYSIPFDPSSGQKEVCGLAVDREHGRVWMADWVDGSYLYCYDLKSRKYAGKVALRPVPGLQQGIFCADGRIIISSDDGDAERGEADRLYICDIRGDNHDADDGLNVSLPASASVNLFREMNDFRMAGEIEGLCIDPSSGDLVVLANRGARIILGMPRGFYDGYDREIHEIYIFSPE